LVLSIGGLLEASWSFKRDAKAQWDKEQALWELMQRHADGIRQLNAATNLFKEIDYG
jgi:hypothetical protein